MALNVKDITSFFDQFRKQGIQLDEKCIAQVLEKRNIAKFVYCKDVTKECFQQILKDLAQGKDCQLSLDQIDKIIRSLVHHCLHGKVDLKLWTSCFSYWTRKDVADKSALIVVDVQNDFISGSLALKNLPAKQDGADVVPVINKLKQDIRFDLTIFTLDWHPSDHCSYYTNVKKYPLHSTSKIKAEDAKMYDVVVYDGVLPQEQTLWPVHCEQGSWGAKLHADLKVDESALLVYKGSVPNIDSYSAFWDNGKLSQTNLFTILLQHNITHAFLCGLASDICVAYSAIDSAGHGFQTFLIEDASKGVADDSIEKAKQKMKDAGVTIINSQQVSKFC